MNRNKFLLLIIVFITALLVSCQSNAPSVTNETASADAIMSGMPAAATAKIAKAAGFNTSYNEFIAEYDDPEIVTLLQTIVSDAVRQPGIVNVTKPHYYMQIDDPNSSSYFLWLSTDRELSALMHTSDSHTLYTIPEHLTKSLKELIPH